MYTTKSFLLVAVLSLVLFSCKKEKEIPSDPLAKKWELTDFKLEIYEDNVLTTNINLSKGSTDYYGVMDLMQDGVYESDIHDEANLQLAYFTFGYSSNNLQNGYSRGVWRKLSDNLLQFDKGIPELLTTLGGEGHTVEYSLSGNQLTVKPHTFDDIAYFGYYAGYESNPPSYFTTLNGGSANDIVVAARGQSDEYSKGYYYGYYIGRFQGQADQLEANGGYYYEPLTYGLLLGSLSTLEDYKDYDNSGTNFESGYQVGYNAQYSVGQTIGDSLNTSPAKSYTLEYKFSEY